MIKNFRVKVTAKIGLLLTLCTVFLCCAIFAFVSLCKNGENRAEAATTISGTTYRISGSSEEMASGWAQAVAASSEETQITVTLGNDWVAANGMFGSNNSAFSHGALCVPSGKNIKLNLAGFRLDRGLTEARDDGSVIVVQGTLYLDAVYTRRTGNGVENVNCDTTITGGYTTGNGGGILIDGGDVTLERTYITGNNANGNGGGVYINSGSLTIKGWADVDHRTGTVILQNFSNGKPNNLYLKRGQTVNINGAIAWDWRTARKIGVTLEAGTGKFTTDYGKEVGTNERNKIVNENMMPADVFFADDYENYTVTSTVNAISQDAEAQLVSISNDTNSAVAKRWNKAIYDSIVTGQQVTFELTADWIAEQQTVYTRWITKFGTGIGFLNGCIVVPRGADIKLDLKGHTIDRRLQDTDGVDYYGMIFGVMGGDLDIYDTVGGGIMCGANTNAGDNCGAMIVSQASTCTMYGGTFKDNHANNYGGAVTACFGTFIMYGGTMTENNASEGGAITVGNTSSVLIYGGNITNNSAVSGGGITYSSSANRLEIYGVKITDNVATGNGGGIHANSTSGLILCGDNEILIENNACNLTIGGGIFIGMNTVTDISGNIKIQNNTASADKASPVTNNLHIYGTTTKALRVEGSLAGSHIGITFTKTNGQITTGYGAHNPSLAVTSVFFSDKSEYKIASANGTAAEAVLVANTTSGTLVCLPIAITGVVYDGSWQNIFEGFNPTYMTAALSTTSTSTAGVAIQTTADGHIQGRQAGTYYVTFTLKSGVWSDGDTNASRTVSVTIAKATYNLAGVYMDNLTVGRDGTSKAGLIQLKGTENLTKLGLSLSGYTYSKGGTAVTAANVKDIGDYTVTAVITGMDEVNYNALPAITAVLTISGKGQVAVPYFDINETVSRTVKYSHSAQTFSVYTSYTSGVTITCDPELSVSGQTITLKANTPAGEYNVYYKIDSTQSLWFDNDQNDIKTLTIKVENYDLSGASFVGASGLTYNGTAQDVVNYSSCTVSGQSALTVQNVKWQFSTDNKSWASTLKITSAGSHTIYWRVSADGYNVKTGSATVSIAKFNLGSLSASDIEFSVLNLIYNGAAQTPTPTVTIINNKLAGTTTLATSDYSFTYANNTNAGTATIRVVGANNFQGTVVCSFTIAPMDLANATFDAIGDKVYTGSDINPTTTVKIMLGSTLTTLGANDFEWVYTGFGSDYKNVGTSVTVGIRAKAGGNYTGTNSTTFDIVQATLSVTLGGDATYDGTAKAPTTAVFGGLLGSDASVITQTAVLAMLDYSKSAAGYDVSRIKAGEYVAIVAWSADGVFANYKLDVGCNAVTGYHFTISKATLTAADISITANGWTYDGLEHDVIAPSTTPSVPGAVAGNTVTFSYSVDGVAYSSTLGFTNVPASGTSYTVHYKVEVSNYETYTGSFTVTVSPRDLSTATLGISDVTALVYNGLAQTPTSYTVKDTVSAGNVLTLVLGTDFSAAYSDNINAGVDSAKITLTGKGNFTGTAELFYSIAQKEITVSWTISGTVTSSSGGKKAFTYNGLGQGDTATAVGAENGEAVTLTLLYTGTDYAGVAYSSASLPQNAGAEYTVTVSLVGWDNYVIKSGETLSKTFEILKKDITSVSGIVVANGGKDYDGTTAATLVYNDPSVLVFAGKVDGDELTVATAVGVYSSANYSATARTVAISGITLGGAAKDNYNLTLTTASTTAFIRKLELTLDWGNTKLLFNGQARLPSVTATNVVAGEEEQIKLALGVEIVGEPAINPANDYVARATLADTSASQNYKLPTDPTTVFEIYSNNVVVYLDVDGIIYDGTAKMPVFVDGNGDIQTLVEGVDYTVVFSARVGASLTNGLAVNAGDYTAVITISPAYMWWDNSDYTTSKSVDFTIGKAVCDLSEAEFNPIVHTYDGALPAIAAGNLPAGIKSVEYAFFAGNTEISGAEAVNYGVYTVVARFVADDNYAFAGGISTLSTTLTVNKTVINLDDISFAGVTGGVLSIVYDGRVHSLATSGSLDGVTAIVYTYVRNSQTVAAESVIGVGTYSVTATFTADNNHEFAGANYKTAQLVINPAPLTVIANPSAIVYGDAPKDGGATFNGLVGGESADALGALSFNVAYTRYGNVGAYAITVNAFTGAGAANYDIKYVEGVLTVKPLEIEVVWQRNSLETSNDFTYVQSGNTAFCPYPVITNIQNGDVLSLTVSGATSTPGFGYEAAVTAINGSKSGNYTLPAIGIKTTFTVMPEPKSGKIIWDNSTLYYNGGEQLPRAYYYESEDATEPTELSVIISGSTRPVNAGSYVARVVTSLDLQGERTHSFTIAKREVYIVIGDMTSAIGMAVDFTKVGWSYLAGSDEFLAGENYTLTFSADYDATKPGNYAIKGAFSSNNAANYSVVFTGSWASTDESCGRCGTLTISKIFFDTSSLSYLGTDVVYDGTTHALTVLGLPSDIAVTLTYVRGNSSWTEGVKDAGTYAVTLSFSYDSAVYDAISPVTVELVVRKASLEIKANDNAVIYGDDAAANGYVITGSGFVAGDDESSLGGAIYYTFGGYSAGGDAGRYLITPAGLTSANYEITFVPGALTVAPRTITVTWFDYATGGTQGTDFTYRYTDGTTEFKPYAVAGGTVDGETVTLTVSGGKKAAGTGYIAYAQLSDPNYALPTDGTASVTFSIIPDADYVVVWVNKTLVYDGNSYVPEAYYFKDGVKTEANVAVYSDENCTSAATALNAGVYFARATAADGSALTNDVFSFEISPRKITVVISDANRVYGQSNPAFTCVYAGGSAELLPSDGSLSSLINIICNATSGSPVGSYAITGSYVGNGNYEVTVQGGTLTVTKATISALPEFADGSVVYDGKSHTLSVNISGIAGVSRVNYTYYKIVNGQRVAVTAGELVNAGSYIIRATFVADGNHEFALGAVDYKEATLEITKLAIGGDLSIDTTVTDFVYNGKPHTLLLTGSANGLTGVEYEYYKDGVKVTDTIGVGTYTVKVTLVFDNDNFVYAGDNPLEAEFTVSPAEITVTADVKVTYGNAINVTASDLIVTGLVGEDTLESLGLTFNIDVRYGSSYGTGAGEYDIVITGASEIGNYVVNYGTVGKLTVTPKVIGDGDVEWFSNAELNLKNFVYDYAAGVSHHPYAKVNDGVLVSGDSLSFVYGAGASEVGFGYVVRITGTGNKNYVLDTKGIISCPFDVLENPVEDFEIVWDYTELYYNGAAQKPAAYYYDDGVRHELTVTVDEGSAVNVGTYTARVSAGSLKLTGDALINFSIEKRSVYIKIGNASAVYGETPNMSAVEWEYAYDDELTRVVSGEAFNITFTHEQVTGVGRYRISGHFVSAGSANYTVVFVGDFDDSYGVLTVNKAAVDLSHVGFDGAQVVYDGKSHTLTLTGVPAGVGYSINYTDGTFAYSAATNAGVYTAEITFNILDAEEAKNYEAIPVMTATLEIRKAALTVKANDNTITYGDEATDGGITVTGFVNGETLATSDVKGGAAFAINYARYGTAGKYRITPSNLSSVNYEITYVSGTLTVAPRELTIEWFDDATRSTKNFSYAYDGVTVYAPYAVAGNTVNGDKVTLTVTGGQSQSGAGYVAKVSSIDNPDYALPTDGSASVRFDVIPAPYTIIWEKTPLYYNGLPQKPAAYYVDGAGRKIELTVTVDEAEFVNAGNYTARVAAIDGLDLSGKYTQPYTIEKLVISIIVGDVTAVYGQNIPASAQWWSYADGSDKFVDGDENYLSRNPLSTAAAGTFDITATFSGSAVNYDFSFVKGTLTVKKAVVSGTPAFTDKTATYDGSIHTVTADISGLTGVISVVYTYEKDGVNYGSNGVTEAGEYFVTAHFTADANHIAPGDMTVRLIVTGKEIDVDSAITFNDVTDAVYNGAAQSVLISGNAEGITGVTYIYTKADGTVIDASEAVNAGSYTVTAVFTADSNHSFRNGKNTVTARLTIKPASLTVRANAVNVTYGEAARHNGYTISGLAAGDTETSVGLTVNIAINGYIAGVTEVGTPLSGAVSLSATVASSNYIIASATGANLTVIPRVITAEEVFWYASADDSEPSDNIEYVYNGGEFVPHAVAVVDGKTVALTVAGGQTNVGANYTARITEVADHNYSLPVGGITKTFSIVGQIRTGAIIWDNSDLYYSGENLKPTAYYLVEGSDEKHFLEVSVSGSSKLVGTYTATVSPDAALNLSGATSMQFSVLPLPVIIAVGDATTVYGDEIVFTDANWNYAEGSAHFIDGESFSIRLTSEGTTVGKYKIAGEFRSANAANYDVSFVGSWASADADNGRYGTLTIVKATIDISSLTLQGTEASYDGKPHAITVSGLPAGVTAHLRYSFGGWNCNPENVVGAGRYDVTITFSVDDTDNYNTVPPMTATLTITPATVTVKALDYTIVYGDRPAAHPDGAVITGVDPSELHGTLTYTFDYRQYQSVGKYTITPSGLTSDNYAITFVPGVLTVEKRVVTIEWFDDDTLGSKTFRYTYAGDSVYFVPHAVAGNLVGGDTVTLTVDGANSKAGLNYLATVTAIDNANYALPTGSAVSQSFDIVPAARVVVWDNTQLYYNGEKQAPRAYCYDENGNLITLVVTVNGDVGVTAVGNNYVATVSDTTGLTGNFSTVFSILPREITVVVSDKTATYGKVSEVRFEAVLASGSLGFVGGDDMSILVLRCAATDESGAGLYTITCEYSGSNYKVTVLNGTLTVVKAEVSVSGVGFVGGSVTYSGETFTLSVNGDLPAGVTSVTYTYYLINPDGTRTLVGSDGVKAAGTYEVVATFTADDNHVFSGDNFKSVTFVVMQAQISGNVSLGDKTLTYNGEVQHVLATGTAQGVTGVTYAYYAGNYVSAGSTLPSDKLDGVKGVGVYTAVATFTVDDNYLPLEAKRALVTVNPATLTVSADDKAVTYGYTLNLGDFTYSYSGLCAGDDFASLNLNISLGVSGFDGNVAVYEITLSGLTSSGNYEVVYESGKLTVRPYELTSDDIVWQASSTDASGTLVYEYDGNEHKPYAYAVVNGERVELTVDGGRVNAGNDYLAQVSGILANTNFALSSTPLTARFTINPVPVDLHIVWENTSVYYDGEAHAPTAYYTVDGGEHIPLIITVDGLEGVSDAGEYTATATLADGNYTLTGNNEAKFTILAAKVYIEISDVPVVYGEVSAVNVVWNYRADSVRLSGGAENGLSFGIDADDLSPVGKYRIYGSYDAAAYPNYDVIFVGSWASADGNDGKCGTLTIGKATFDTSAITVTNREVIYNGKLQKPEISGLPAGVEAVLSFTLGNWGFGNDGVLNTGRYDVVISFVVTDATLSGNYYAIPDALDEFIIDRAPLTIKANDNTVIYGETPSAAGVDFAAAGFVDGENERILKGTLSYTFDYRQYQSVGKYSITPSGLTSDNYAITFVSGTLTVAPRTIEVIWYSENGGNRGTEFNYDYDGTVHQPYAVAGNVANNDSLTLTVTGGRSEAGMGYVARVTAINGSRNYVLPEAGLERVIFNVIPEAYVVVWENTEFTYNGNEQVPKAYYFTPYGGRVELKVTTNKYAADAGEYVATASRYPGNTAPITGELERVYVISKLAVSIVIEDAGSEYGDEISINPNGWHYAEGSGTFTDGNFITLECNVEAGAAVGSYANAITCSFSNPNYTVTYRNGTYTVTRKVLEVPTLDAVDYDGNAHTATVDDDLPYYVASPVANVTKTDVGTYEVVLALRHPENYVWADCDTVTVVVSFVINKVDNDWVSGYEFAIQGGTVEAGSGNIAYSDYKTLFETDITVKFYRDEYRRNEVTEDYVKNSATLGEKFFVVVTVAETNNFYGFEFETTVTIVGKLKVTLEWLDETLVYDGTAQAPRAYVWIGTERVWLEVDGAATDAGDYVAIAKRVALGGFNLDDYEFSNDEADFERAFTINARKLVVSIDDTFTTVYGTLRSDRVDLSYLNWTIASGHLVGGDGLSDLGISFECDFGGLEYANVGKYAIIGVWTNGNYDIEFIGNWNGGDEYDGRASTCTVTEANISVDKTGSEWVEDDDLDDGAIIDLYQNYFVNLDAKDENGAYKFIRLKGDQSAEISVTYSARAYNFGSVAEIPVLSESQIAQYVIDGQTTSPEIRQAGIWVVYYRIEAPNHQVKYGQWRVLILKNTDYVTITFEKPYSIAYGDSIEGGNLIDELIDGGYISVSGAITDLEMLRRYAEAYAYEDFGSGTVVGGGSGASKYTIAFRLNETAEGMEEFANVAFRYRTSNDPTEPDHNVGAYEIIKRELSIVWGVTSFTYDGTAKAPSAHLTGLIGGEEVELMLAANRTQVVTLANGDVIYLDVSMIGDSSTNVGSFRLLVSLDDENYKLSSTGNFADVTITARELTVVWGEREFAYDGQIHLPTLTVDGKTVEYSLESGSVTVEITLDNGDVLPLTLEIISGTNAKDAGSYTLLLTLGDSNYKLSAFTDRVTVTITDASKIGLPTWAIILIAVACVLAVLIIIVLVSVLKKRDRRISEYDEMIDEDGFNDPIDME